MSVFGIDLGNLYSSVSMPRRKGIDVIMNEVSKRETQTFVSFGDEKSGRLLGEKGADARIRNFRNTVNSLKRLVGLKYGCADWEKEAKFSLFRTVEGKDGFLEVEVDFEGEQKSFRPEQIIAMMLRQLTTYADREANDDAGLKDQIKLVDFVMSCPPYYTAFQRKLLQQSAQIAGLNCLTLVTEGTAVALSWGIYKELPEKEEDGIIVQFCDVGHSATYISTVQFWKGNLKVLSHVYDKHLGCRDFDLALLEYFRKEIQAKYKIDVNEQKRARLRLLAACEKLRYTLSANPIVPAFNVESLMDDIDISFSKYHREHFEEMTDDLWKRMENLVARATEGVDVSKLHSIELVGGGSYMPKVRKILADAYNRTVSSTMNVSEAVAKGCGLIGAILSPRVRVDFQVHDAQVHEIVVGYHSATAQKPISVSFIPEINKQYTLYAHNCNFPKVFDLTFDKKESFDLHAFYREPNQEVLDTNGSLVMGHWTFHDLPPFKNLQGEIEADKPVKVAVRFKLNSSGYVTVESATVTEEYEEEVKVEKKPEEKKDDEKKEEKEAEPEVVMKKRTRKLDVNVRVNYIHGLTTDLIEKYQKDEDRMHRSDVLLAETQESKNAVESYAYEFLTKTEESGELFDYMPQDVRVAFRKACNDTVDWLYADGEDSTKTEYVNKLNELRKDGDAAVKRKRMREDLPFTFTAVENRVLKVMDESNRLLGTETHIPKDKLEEIVQKATAAREFFKAEKQKLETTPKDHDIDISDLALEAKASEVETFSKPIFSTPKPAPPKEETKEAESPKKEEQPENKEAKAPEAGMDVD